MISVSRVIALFAFLSVVAAAQGADTYVGRCDVVFKVDSSMHTVTGDISNIPLVVHYDTNSAGDAVLNTRIEIAATRLNTHNKKRDAHMYKMFRADVYPELVAAVSNAPAAAANLGPGPGAPGPGSLPVWLTICGVTREVQARILNPQKQPDGWSFDLTGDVSLKAFHLKPPTALLGILTVGDIVAVKAHVSVQKRSARP